MSLDTLSTMQLRTCTWLTQYIHRFDIIIVQAWQQNWQEIYLCAKHLGNQQCYLILAVWNEGTSWCAMNILKVTWKSDWFRNLTPVVLLPRFPQTLSSLQNTYMYTQLLSPQLLQAPDSVTTALVTSSVMASTKSCLPHTEKASASLL